MDYIFDWHGSQGYLDDKTRTEIENQVKEEIEDQSEFNKKFSPCHPGPVEINLTYSLLSPSGFAGNASCECGKPYLKIEGKEINKGVYERNYEPV